MKNKQLIKSLALAFLGTSLIWLNSCEEVADAVGGLANEVTLTGASELSFLEKDTTITVSYEFTIPARSAGTATISAAVVELAHGVNYTTTPAESGGSITASFDAGAASVSFDINVIDDDQDLESNGSVTFTLTEIAGEDATVGAATFKLTIIDNEGGSITLDSEEAVKFGEVVPGTESEAKEITFTSVNILSDFEATTTEGFTVSASADGTFASTATIPATATSIFVKAAPLATASFGSLDGTVTFGSGDTKATVDLQAVVSGSIGVLFWAEDFDYPVDDTYPSYGENGENWGIVPVSAHYRLTAQYNGTNPNIVVQSGLERMGSLDTWYIQSRLAGISMGDNPLSFTGYPGSGIGRTLKLGLDVGNYAQRNDCKEEGVFLAKNTVAARRFVENGSEIKTGNVYFSSMIKVDEVFPEETPVLKNAVMMLTGDAAFVNSNAMKLNVRDDGAGGFNFGVSKSADDGSVVYGSTSYALGTTYAIVFKVEIKEDLEGEDPNDVVSVYVFEEGESIPDFEDASLTAEAVINVDNQGDDVHDVVDGLEILFTREVADVFAAGGPTNINVQKVEFSGLRVATSWNALFKDASEALHDSVSDDQLQTMKYGREGCPLGPGPKLGQTDI